MKITAQTPNMVYFETAARNHLDMNYIHKTAYYTECAAMCFNSAECISFKYFDKGNVLLNECHTWKTFP